MTWMKRALNERWKIGDFCKDCKDILKDKQRLNENREFKKRY